MIKEIYISKINPKQSKKMSVIRKRNIALFSVSKNIFCFDQLFSILLITYRKKPIPAHERNIPSAQVPKNVTERKPIMT